MASQSLSNKIQKKFWQVCDLNGLVYWCINVQFLLFSGNGGGSGQSK